MPKYQNPQVEINKNEYFDDFEKLLIAFGKISSDKKRQFISDLKNYELIHSENPTSKKTCFRKPFEVYLRTTDLEEYFSGIDSVFFVSEDLYKKFGDKTLETFLLDIGCETKPRRIEINANLSLQEKNKLRGIIGCTRENYAKDYEYDGLDNFIQNLSKERAYLIWNFLLNSIVSYEGWKPNFFKGEYSWFYRSNQSKQFDSKFVKILKESAWLVDKNGDFRKPSEISISDLSDMYRKDDDNVKFLEEALGFIRDEIKVIEQKTGGKFITKEEFAEFQRLKEEKAKKESTDKLVIEWKPELQPDEVVIKVVEIDPTVMQTPDLGYQSPKDGYVGDDGKPIVETKTDVDADIPQSSSLNAINVGYWGENYVYKFLRQKFGKEEELEETDLGFTKLKQSQTKIEVKWLNKKGERGKGYDFVIVSDGIEIEYIEVKSKRGGEEELIPITGEQWEFARKLFDRGEGEKYKIYLVSNAGSENANIKILTDPIKLWKDGKLYAHPVNFKL